MGADAVHGGRVRGRARGGDAGMAVSSPGPGIFADARASREMAVVGRDDSWLALDRVCHGKVVGRVPGEMAFAGMGGEK